MRPLTILLGCLLMVSAYGQNAPRLLKIAPYGVYYEAMHGALLPGVAFNSTVALQATSFIATSPYLQDIEFVIEKTSTLGASGSVNVTLNADSGGLGTSDVPGAVLSTIIVFTDVMVPVTNTMTAVDVNNMRIAKLIPGTKYWIVIQKNGTNTTELKGYTSIIAPTNGLGGSMYAVNGTISAATPPSGAICVSAYNNCPAASNVPTRLTYPSPGVN